MQPEARGVEELRVELWGTGGAEVPACRCASTEKLHLADPAGSWIRTAAVGSAPVAVHGGMAASWVWQAGWAAGSWLSEVACRHAREFGSKGGGMRGRV